MLILLGFAFLSGLVTMLAPCIWPLLPIVLSSAAAGKDKGRPLGITLGIMVSFGLLTLAISSLVRVFHIDPNLLRLVAVVVIGVMGLGLLIPALGARLETAVSGISGIFPRAKIKDGGIGAGFITGLALGIVWTPCAGPILAAIASLATLGMVNINVILITTAYVLGIGVPLFIFTYSGQQILTQAKIFSGNSEKIRRIFGGVMIITAAAIFTNFDVYIQAQLLNAFPWFNSTLNSFENNPVISRQLNILEGKIPTTKQITDPLNVLNSNYPAPELTGITKWLNTDSPLTIYGLKGHVVLIDFWTYTCINCVRTLPYLTDWYNKYKDQGLVIIGVHTPEFQFEHDTGNVQAAIKMFGITYPVAQDNNYATWGNYNNQYWPAEYLIDANGVVRRTHFGEGEYDKTEMAIQTLLRDAGKTVTNSGLVNLPNQTPTNQISPETYLGSDRMEYYFPGGNTGNGKKVFKLTDNPPTDTFSLGGEWDISGENAISGNNAVLNYHFSAAKVYLVMRPGPSGAGPGKVKVLMDNVQTSEITVDSDRLYTLIDLGNKTGDHILKLEFENPGTEVYAFTFG